MSLPLWPEEAPEEQFYLEEQFIFGLAWCRTCKSKSEAKKLVWRILKCGLDISVAVANESWSGSTYEIIQHTISTYWGEHFTREYLSEMSKLWGTNCQILWKAVPTREMFIKEANINWTVLLESIADQLTTDLDIDLSCVKGINWLTPT